MVAFGSLRPSFTTTGMLQRLDTSAMEISNVFMCQRSSLAIVLLFVCFQNVFVVFKPSAYSILAVGCLSKAEYKALFLIESIRSLAHESLFAGSKQNSLTSL